MVFKAYGDGEREQRKELKRQTKARKSVKKSKGKQAAISTIKIDEVIEANAEESAEPLID